MKTLSFSIVLLSMLFACGGDAPPAEQSGSARTAAVSANAANIYDEAVSNTSRSVADRGKDAGRKPAEVLTFFDVQPGMTVLDLFSGGGYYSELLSRVVGPEGSVFAHTNEAYAQFVGEEASSRYANNRLPNVQMLHAENNALELPANKFDVVMMVLAYHDIYYVAAEEGWPKIDGPPLLAELFQGMKPGGTLAIVDHSAAAGSPPETGSTLHRIDPEIVIAEVQAAGFELDARSNLLGNPDDDLSLPMSAPEIQGKTDRFLLKFRKPN